MSMYNLRHDGDQYRVTKFDADMNPESSYLCTETECECPAGHRPTCRHRQMFPTLLTLIGSGWLYDFDRNVWAAQVSGWEEPTNIAPEPNELADDFDAKLDAVINGEPVAEGAPPVIDPTPPQPQPFKRRF